MKFCSKCGSQIPDDAQFCGECGAKIVEESLSQPTTTNSSPKVSPNGIVLESAAPIPSQRITWRISGYFAGVTLCLLGRGFVRVTDVAGLLIIIAGFIVVAFTGNKDENSMKEHWENIRTIKFKFINGVTIDEIYNKLQPALTAKYGDKIKFDREEDILNIYYGKKIYDLKLNDDATFTLYWYPSFSYTPFDFTVNPSSSAFAFKLV